ncbi:protein NUCLEAR FUSION DEFECTIVE 4-like [Hordeum vulgare subsp. vulgare]|uniref:Nodulin-like domain-containing protein n=1 Tax=Hordeum vulgare subsp. vulgare TaxID=112509 RepID=A0A8I6XR70_HORVV|nr:protein NUCLEAR FUSION DEFECTIVE 4-like [Hordeum vulgare subsp. vulgare]
MVTTALDAMAGTAWGRWLGLVAAVWVQCISGNNYTFSNYSDSIKTLMGLTQLQLNGLSVAKDVGKAFGLLAGLASDRVPTWLLLAVGSLEGFLGYGAQWLVVSRAVAPLPYWQMCVCLCLGGNSTTWMNTAVLVTCIRNFRGSRGPVSGVLKGYVGLSTAIFTDVCSALFADDPASFLVMLAVVPAAVCAVAMVFLREGRVADSDCTGAAGDEADARGFAAISTLAVAIALYLLAADLTGVGGGGGVVSTVFVAVLMVLLAAPVAVPAYVGWTSWMKSRKAANADAEDAAAPLLLDSKAAAAAQQGSEAEEARGPGERPRLGEEHTIAEALASVDFWVLFSSFLMGVGTGLAVMNNLGQMGVAMGYADVSLFVSMTSIWGFFGRIASGTISEHFIKTRALPRPVWNAASQVLMCAGYVLMAFGMPGSLFVGSVVVGVCYGVRLAVTVPTASELFGLKYYGLIYNILILNLPLGSFLFSGLLAGLLYDAEATKVPGGGNTCSGAHCYRLVFVVMAAACVVGFGLDVLLSLRTRRVYAKIHQAKRAKRLAAAAQRVS